MNYYTRKIYSIVGLLLRKIRNGKRFIVDWNHTLIEKGVSIDCRTLGTIDLKSSTLERNVYIASSGTLKIGNRVFFNRNSIVVCQDRIEIGDNCFFGPNVCVYDHDHNFDATGKKDGFKRSPVYIGANCWIGANTVILRGTTIGRNCIIGAGVVVKGTIPDNSLVKSGRDISIEALR